MEAFIRADQFERVYALLRQEGEIHTKQREKVRAFLEAVFWGTRSGARWRFLPAEYGEWNSVYKRFALGRPGRLGPAVRGGGGRPRPAGGAHRRDRGARARLRRWRAPKNGGQAAQGLGRARGGFSTKIHVLVDALGNPLKLRLTSGAAGDNPPAIPLLDGTRAQEVLADRSYDADKTIAYIEGEMQAVATIPPRKNRVVPRDCDSAAYRERHLVECCIGKRTYCRRVCSRFDKYAKRFLACVHFACTFIWLK